MKHEAGASFPLQDLEVRLAVLDSVSQCQRVGVAVAPEPIGLGARRGSGYVRRCRVLCRECGDFGRIKDVPLADFIIVSPLHQIDMDVVFMIRICSVAEYRRKAGARRLP